MKTYQYCSNCGKSGHTFQNCKKPIISSGIIAFKITNGIKKYLMICRKDSLGFVDFMRGKYNITNRQHILNLINEMTITEKNMILNNDFEQLWKYLWGDYSGKQYKNEEKSSREKFNKLKSDFFEDSSLDILINESTNNWEEPEWGFPKGRRDKDEKDIKCATREYIEETGHPYNSFEIIQNILPFEEYFTGSNCKSYKHKYYLAYMKNENISNDRFQRSEVSNMKWCTIEECLNLIRPYCFEKKKIILNIEKVLKNNTLLKFK